MVSMAVLGQVGNGGGNVVVTRPWDVGSLAVSALLVADPASKQSYLKPVCFSGGDWL